MDLRVVSGSYRGTKLASPNSEKTHPMGAREKLALFNMVDATGVKVLDAYAGTGALGIEALSRGAELVVFVEKSPQTMQILRQNEQKICSKCQNMAKLNKFFTQTVENFAKKPEFRGYFDLILADPPYDHLNIGEIQDLVDLLANAGRLMVSSPAEQDVPDLSGVELISSRTYARARLSVYVKNSENC